MSQSWVAESIPVWDWHEQGQDLVEHRLKGLVSISRRYIGVPAALDVKSSTEMGGSVLPEGILVLIVVVLAIAFGLFVLLFIGSRLLLLFVPERAKNRFGKGMEGVALSDQAKRRWNIAFWSLMAAPWVVAAVMILIDVLD